MSLEAYHAKHLVQVKDVPQLWIYNFDWPKMNHQREDTSTCTYKRVKAIRKLQILKIKSVVEKKVEFLHIGEINSYVSARKKLCWWSSLCIVVTSLMLANPPSTLVYKLRELTINSPTCIYHGSTHAKTMLTSSE